MWTFFFLTKSRSFLGQRNYSDWNFQPHILLLCLIISHLLCTEALNWKLYTLKGQFKQILEFVKRLFLRTDCYNKLKLDIHFNHSFSPWDIQNFLHRLGETKALWKHENRKRMNRRRTL